MDEHITNSKNYFNIFYTNCNSILNKLNELKTISSDNKCQVLCLTETHLTPDVLNAEIFIPNFKIYRKDRAVGKEGGGSLVYVHNTLNSSQLDT